jgi:hypothetical protein
MEAGEPPAAEEDPEAPELGEDDLANVREIMDGVGVPDLPADIYAGGTGYSDVRDVHAPERDIFGPPADSVGSGPLQLMANDDRFRTDYGGSVSRRDMPYLSVSLDDRLVIIVKRPNYAWNAGKVADVLARKIEGAIERARSAGEPPPKSVYGTLAFSFELPPGAEKELGRREPSPVHWLGIELHAGPPFEVVEVGKRSVERRVTVYDPAGSGGKSGEPVYSGADEITLGIAPRLLLDRRVGRGLGWYERNIPPELRGPAAEVIRLGQEFILQDVEAHRKLPSLIMSLGIVGFAPKGGACQSGLTDFFCQSWALYFFAERSKGKTVQEIERRIGDLCRQENTTKAEILRFVAGMTKSDPAREFWTQRSYKRREEGAETSGEAFYAWLRWAVDTPAFGDELEEACELPEGVTGRSKERQKAARRRRRAEREELLRQRERAQEEARERLNRRRKRRQTIGEGRKSIDSAVEL